ncbi:hypothetical protein D9M70_600700 [compost metagenome]
MSELDRKTKPSPEIAATMPGTRARRAAMPPYNTGLIVTRCTICGRKRRNRRTRAISVPSSCKGCLPLRVMGMTWCVIPSASMSATAGPSMVATCTS